jgi:O-antigen ligase
LIIFYIVVLLSAVPKHPWFGEEVAGFTIAKYLGILCLVYTLLALVLRTTVPGFFSNWPARLFLAFTIWSLLSCIFVSNVSTLFTIAQPLISYLAIFFAVLCCVDSLHKLQYTALALIGALDLASLYSLREYQKMGFGSARVGWVAGDGNFFACAALLVIPLAYQLISTTNHPILKWFYRISLLLTFLAFVAAGSRGGLAGLCAVVTLVLLRSEKKLQSLFVAALMLLVLLFSPVSPVKRLLSPGYGDIVSVQNHEALWSFGIHSALQHPFFGIGVGNFKRLSAATHVTERLDGYEAHNTYIHLAAETGLFGFLLYLALCISTFVLLQKVRHYAELIKHRYLYSLATGLQDGLVGFSAAAIFISAQSEKPFWIVISMTAVLPLIVSQQFAAVPTKVKRAPFKLAEQALFSKLPFSRALNHGHREY